jgi:hypothetical protein
MVTVTDQAPRRHCVSTNHPQTITEFHVPQPNASCSNSSADGGRHEWPNYVAQQQQVNDKSRLSRNCARRQSTGVFAPEFAVRG